MAQQAASIIGNMSTNHTCTVPYFHFQNVSLTASGSDVYQLRPEHGAEGAVPVLPGRLVGPLPVGQELKHSLLQVFIFSPRNG